MKFHQDLKKRPPGTARILFASVAGTTIEFYDFYIYTTAAALVIGPVFFPTSDPSVQTLNAFLTFGLAFIARPVGSALFGHFGDRIGRKSTLVASLMTMGLSTVLIGLLPGYDTLGSWAAIALCILRFGQGIGLGGEWGGAALIARENAAHGRTAWFGMYPQLGPSIGFLLANGLYLVLVSVLSEDAFRSWGWRLPFVGSAVLVAIGLYVRVSLLETPAFVRAMAERRPLAAPLATLLRTAPLPLVQGSLSIVVCYTLFYMSTGFALNHGVTTLHIPKNAFLLLLCIAILFMAAGTPLSAWLADRYGRRPVLLAGAAAAAGSGFLAPVLLAAGDAPRVLAFLSLELFLMGMTFGPLGALLPELFATRLRYTGAALAYSLGGILGASLAPYIAQHLADAYGLAFVGYYISVAALISFASVLSMRETRGEDLMTAADLKAPLR